MAEIRARKRPCTVLHFDDRALGDRLDNDGETATVLLKDVLPACVYVYVCVWTVKMDT